MRSQKPGSSRPTRLDAADPLGALPEVAARHDQSQRPAVFRRERGSIVDVGKKNVIKFELRERQVGRESLLGVDRHEPALGTRPARLQHRAKRDAFPEIVVTTPARDAMDVAVHLGARQLPELFPVPALDALHESVHPEIPTGQVHLRHRAVMQHGPLLRQDLSRGKPGFLLRTDHDIGRIGVGVHGRYFSTEGQQGRS